MRKIFVSLIIILCLVLELIPVFAHAEGEIAVGDTVSFGSYEQDNDEGDGAEKIKWRVLATDGDKATLISCWILDTCQYNNKSGETTWENSYIRSWLSTYFYECAFTEDEKAHIATSLVKADSNPKYDTDCGNDTEDKVYLLSFTEAKTFFDYTAEGAETYKAANEVVHPDLMGFYTPYAAANGAYMEDLYNSGVWWCRTQGITGGEACNVSWAGFISSYGHFTTMSSYGVRPVIQVDVSALEKTEADVYPDYAAIGSGDESEEVSAEESSEAIAAESSAAESSAAESSAAESSAEELSEEASSEAASEPQSTEVSEESTGEVVVIPPVSSVESSEDSAQTSASSDGESKDDGKLSGGGTVDNRFIIIGVLMCILAALLIFKIAYSNYSRKKNM